LVGFTLLFRSAASRITGDVHFSKKILSLLRHAAMNRGCCSQKSTISLGT